MRRRRGSRTAVRGGGGEDDDMGDDRREDRVEEGDRDEGEVVGERLRGFRGGFDRVLGLGLGFRPGGRRRREAAGGGEEAGGGGEGGGSADPRVGSGSGLADPG